jgi:hypothetical protein
MNERRVLVFFLIFAALVGAINTYLHTRVLFVPAWWQFGSLVLFVLFILAWYHYDSISNGYNRSKWMNAAVLFMALVAIPFYLVQSRKGGQKLKALLGLTWFVLLFLLSALLGGLAGRVFG